MSLVELVVTEYLSETKNRLGNAFKKMALQHL